MKILINGILFLFSVLFMNTVYAQEIYSTTNGSLEVRVISSGKVLKFKSPKLMVMLNYEDATFEMKLDKSTLSTGIDSIDQELSQLTNDLITLRGRMGVEYINTQGHPPLDFIIEGVLSTNDDVIDGEAHLEHISNRGKYSCLLTISFDLKFGDLGIAIDGFKPDDEVQIQVIQIVMNRIEDQ